MLQVPSTARQPRKWTIAEDQKLREEVEAQLIEGEVKDWCRIANAIPGRSNKDCRKRWKNALEGGLRKGQWSKSEDTQLARGVQRHGQRWVLVAEQIKTRSADQCAKRWQQSLDPDLDRSEWRETEDEILIQAVQKFGRHWKDIQRQCFPTRSKNCIKNR
ncbi:transcription factor, Myb superfamily [Polyplosphaeria fusca]|uniref:Transcription factor, Myb superfamily n=1 Tax=Polyplosphaeria fusca TaxID=682080 RepID=A0A9P4V0G3_9PLEO|nr:transcription factor, Myb superfamily [Polyplosphaeria fusca]